MLDQANVLSSQTKEDTNKICTTLWTDKKVAIYIVTLGPDMASIIQKTGIEKTAQNLFDTWGIGSASRNYGILLLISPSERTSRIEFGKAWDHRYDSEANEITKNFLVPNFKESNYNLGILEGTKALDSLVRGLGVPAQKAPAWLLPLIIGLVILIIAVAISLMLNGKAGWGWGLLALLGVAIFFLLKNSKSSGSSLGGGSSGGGGATGKW